MRDLSKNKPISSQTNSENSPLVEGWQTKSDGVFKNYKKLPYNPKLKDRVRELRKAGNLAEVLFWDQVKNKKFLSLDFHRQKIIGNLSLCRKINWLDEEL
ncbi:MAG: DUF559 domain-containing protein [Candidatus Cloacimonetes bacterium]|jgi:hypothetical protein|nr:DUF559 domain-containing protein [Candidatus Cloacimonadota bacterium]